jgi:general secretion pathway protein K
MKIHRHNSSGIALIIVMVAIAVLSFMAAGFALAMKVETKLAQNAESQDEIYWLGRSGVEYARWILSQEAAIPGQPYDALNQKWAGGSGSMAESNSVLAGISLENYPIGDGTVSLKIVDCERKVNINTASTATLQQALNLMGADADDISVIADSIQDWIDPDDNQRIAGAENDYYQSLVPAYHAKNAPIADLSELLLIKGITPEIYHGGSPTNYTPGTLQLKQRLGLSASPGQIPNYPFGLADLFTPVSSGQLNINTADVNTLQLIPGVDNRIAAQIILIRAGLDGVEGTDDDMPIQNPGAALQQAGVNPALVSLSAGFCGVRSATFEVHVTAHLGNVTREYIATLFRASGTDIQVVSFYWK